MAVVLTRNIIRRAGINLAGVYLFIESGVDSKAAAKRARTIWLLYLLVISFGRVPRRLTVFWWENYLAPKRQWCGVSRSC